MGDDTIDALSSPSYAHYRTNGGRIVVQMGDDTIDALSSPSCAHYRTDGGRIVVQMGRSLLPKWGMLPPPYG